MNKKDLSERDICTKFITPALTTAGWDINSQVRERVYLTDGQVIVRGRMVRRAGRVLGYKRLHYLRVRWRARRMPWAGLMEIHPIGHQSERAASSCWLGVPNDAQS